MRIERLGTVYSHSGHHFAVTALSYGDYLCLLVGSVHERRDDVDDSKVSNVQLLISPHGVRIAKYRKTHLFDSPRYYRLSLLIIITIIILLGSYYYCY